jgi:tetratricopeptide (TPR) repeat protein
MDEAEKLLAGLKKRDKSSRIMGMQVMILTGKAAIALRKRDNAGAEKFYKEAVAVKGAAVADTVNAYNEYINFLLRQKRFSDTEKALNTLLTLPAKDAETKFKIASCRKQYLVTVKKYDEAITLMEETAKLKGLRPATKARCYAFIAQICLFDKKDAASAMKYIKKAEGVPGGRWKCPAYMKKYL